MKQDYSGSADLLHQCQNFNRKWSGIQIWILGFVWIGIRMPVRSVPKCCGCIFLSASVILPSMVQIGRWLC